MLPTGRVSPSCAGAQRPASEPVSRMTARAPFLGSTISLALGVTDLHVNTAPKSRTAGEKVFGLGVLHGRLAPFFSRLVAGLLETGSGAAISDRVRVAEIWRYSGA